MAPSLVSTFSAAVVLSSAALHANAHQVVLLPAPTYTTDDKDTKYAPLAFLEDQGFATQEDFTAWRQDNSYDSLRAFNDGASYTVSDGADFTCGFTNIKGDAQPIPDGNAMRSTGYTHDSPCEVWLDDTMVMQYDNCHESISGKDYTIDYSSYLQGLRPPFRFGSPS
ncbi:hypothetical protein PC129_g13265 [Phytophthora cactorum]|uniref:Uncharacterized protein n=1 Tax=Phytophthora cactorum TaxID=29920 RepID=A0A8T1BNQ7_9STRA|nr:hypothetical protein PC112_g15133 [Phytophthora cactorum]KAG2814242.1 hypothetical protein PC111_g14060 [Phytophthora cactorum]KAG2852062.1 hypothetical protein PC113_g15355 [Phytophthora cactorum]KAG2896527.1 hypothetical protein PC114_g15050 [Phytophthora cactorum]KAG2905742.1 hypothetical protein PC115_g14511 [Phytophthora cactorum]